FTMQPPAPTYTLSLHDALPILPSRTVPASVRDELAAASQWLQAAGAAVRPALDADPARPADAELLCAIPEVMVPQRRRPGPSGRSEEHTSELQSQSNLVCRLLL